MDFYFPFVDGLFGYDCVSCGSHCCRGHGLSLSKAELDTLDAAYPGLRLFAAAPPSAVRSTLVVVEPPPRCYFLSSDGRCRVERELGRVRKPTGCRLFPFNDFLGHDELVVVGYNPLCPLQLAHGRELRTRVHWSELRVELEAVDDPSQFTARGMPARLRAGFREAIARERLLLDATRAPLAAADLQAALTPWAGPAASLHERRGRIAQLLGIADGEPSAATARACIAVLPWLRLKVALLEACDWSALDDYVVAHLAGLTLLAVAHERLAQQPLSPSGLLHLHAQMEPLLWYLRRLDERPRLGADLRPRVSPQIRQPTQRLLAAVQSGAETLSEAILRAEPDSALRAGFLRALGPVDGLVTDRAS